MLFKDMGRHMWKIQPRCQDLVNLIKLTIRTKKKQGFGKNKTQRTQQRNQNPKPKTQKPNNKQQKTKSRVTNLENSDLFIIVGKYCRDNTENNAWM